MTTPRSFKPSTRIAVLSLACAAAVLSMHSAFARSEGVALAAPKQGTALAPGAMRTAVFAGGCFWGMEAVFEHVKGVADVTSGYSGGDKATATYEQIGTGRTGHAEAVKVTYDPAKVSYGQLLQVYFSVAHDPTQLNRQSPDVGTQYRSEIFTTDDTQAAVARAYIAQLGAARAFDKPIVTKVSPLKAYYPAEAYHQDFLRLHPTHPYIVYNDAPKLVELKKLYPAIYVADGVRVAKR